MSGEPKKPPPKKPRKPEDELLPGPALPVGPQPDMVDYRR